MNNKKYLEIGKIVSTHSIKGEVKVQPWCDEPQFLCEFPTLYTVSGGRDNKKYTPVKVERARIHKNMAILKLEGVDTMDDAVKCRGSVLYIDRDDAPVEDGQFYIQDIVGLDVVDVDSGKIWGKLTDVFQTGANDVYECTTDAGEKLLFPAIHDVVINTDIASGKIEIRPLEGLFENSENGDVEKGE